MSHISAATRATGIATGKNKIFEFKKFGICCKIQNSYFLGTSVRKEEIKQKCILMMTFSNAQY
jgi:hypothetical protein